MREAKEEIHSIWDYCVRDEYLSDFIKAYAPAGDWARLFQKCPGYIETELHQAIDQPLRFVTIDHWQSYTALQDMLEKISDDYKRLDKLCEKYTFRENHIGIFRKNANVFENTQQLKK